MVPPGGLSRLIPQQLSLNELRQWHQKLGAWLDAAEASPPDEGPHEETVEAVRAALAMLTRERRERQSDERRDS